MRASLKTVTVGLAVVLAGVSFAGAADPVTQCGAAQLKVLATVYKAYTAEGTRACVAGSSGHPQPVDVTKLTAATDKASAALQAAIDKFGLDNCFTKTGLDPSNIIELARGVARQLCLAPSPTPTP